MSFLNGTYRILSIKVSGNYLPIACLESNSFSETIDFLDTTTRSNPNGWKSSIPTMQGYEIPFNGIISTDGTNKVSYRDLEGLKRAKTRIEWKLESLEGDDIDYGDGYLSGLTKDASIDEHISFSGSIVGYSEPLIEVESTVYEFDVYDNVYE